MCTDSSPPLLLLLLLLLPHCRPSRRLQPLKSNSAPKVGNHHLDVEIFGSESMVYSNFWCV